jgi:hypothetical protein
MFITDPGSENFFIPDPRSYKEKLKANLNLPFMQLTVQFQEAQFHKDERTRILKIK